MVFSVKDLMRVEAKRDIIPGLCGVVQRGESLFWSGLYNALLFAAAFFNSREIAAHLV